MSEPFIGEIRMFAGNFAPVGWAKCDGQLLPITSYTALFSLLGTTYGGDGEMFFGLPDLRSRIPVHAGDGPGLTSRSLGSKIGQETVALNEQQIPSHDHALRGSQGFATQHSPASARFAQNRAGMYSVAAPNVSLSSTSVTLNGDGEAHENMAPYLAVNYIIALNGLFPSP